MKEICIKCKGKGYHIRTIPFCRKLKYRKPCPVCGGQGIALWIDNIKGNDIFVTPKNFEFIISNITREKINLGSHTLDPFKEPYSSLYFYPYNITNQEFIKKNYHEIRDLVNLKKIVIYKSCTQINNKSIIMYHDKMLEP